MKEGFGSEIYRALVLGLVFWAAFMSFLCAFILMEEFDYYIPYIKDPVPENLEMTVEEHELLEAKKNASLKCYPAEYRMLLNTGAVTQSKIHICSTDMKFSIQGLPEGAEIVEPPWIFTPLGTQSNDTRESHQFD